jgi:curved DNA-binding protein CbpA
LDCFNQFRRFSHQTLLFPDKGGDPELFKEMSEAYAILGDDDKRAKYDKYGHDAPDDGRFQSNHFQLIHNEV